MKNKNVAGVIAILVGIFGTHRFYLGQRFLGALYFLLFWGGLAITIEEGNPIIMLLPALISLVDGIVFLAMPWEDFDRRYNKAYFKRREEQVQERPTIAPPVQVGYGPESKFEYHKREGIRKFRARDFAGAVADFLETLTVRANDPAMCFNLACCYSMLGQAKSAFHYLESAVSGGFEDTKKIHQHQALAFVRDQPQFEAFVRNGYTLQPQTPAEEPEFLDLNLHNEVEIPEPLLKLEDLKNRGILTEEEFEEQKQKMFGFR